MVGFEGTIPPELLPAQALHPPPRLLACSPTLTLALTLTAAEFFHLLEAMCRQIRGLDAPFGGLQARARMLRCCVCCVCHTLGRRGRAGAGRAASPALTRHPSTPTPLLSPAPCAPSRGAQLVLCGDFFQLSPITARASPGMPTTAFLNRGWVFQVSGGGRVGGWKHADGQRLWASSSPLASVCAALGADRLPLRAALYLTTQSPAWQRCKLEAVVLTKIWRQSDQVRAAGCSGHSGRAPVCTGAGAGARPAAQVRGARLAQRAAALVAALVVRPHLLWPNPLCPTPSSVCPHRRLWTF